MKIYKMLFYLSFICLSVALFIINFLIDIQSPLFETSHTILAFSGIIFLIICIDMIISEGITMKLLKLKQTVRVKFNPYIITEEFLVSE